MGLFQIKGTTVQEGTESFQRWDLQSAMGMNLGSVQCCTKEGFPAPDGTRNLLTSYTHLFMLPS